MGGNGGANQKTSSSTSYKTTTTSNPYITSTTSNKGTNTAFAPNSAMETFNNFYGSNVGGILNEMLNPTVDSQLNRNLMSNYARNLNNETNKNLEGIVNNLANRGLVKSSIANDMYNKLNATNADNLANYQASLLQDTQNTASNTFNNLMNAYLQGWNIVNGNQAQSLNTSSGNATTNTKGKSTNISL